MIGRAQREGRWWYYLDDGMYGSFSGQLYDHAHYPVDGLDRRGPRHPCVLAGPTCDSIDVIREDIPLPELEIGDLLVGRMMGAYTAGDGDGLQLHSPRQDRGLEPACQAPTCALRCSTTSPARAKARGSPW